MDSATALAVLTVEELARAGVAHAVLCPGSRSAPLAYRLHAAAAAGGPRLWVRHDERSAGFTALGVGKATEPDAGGGARGPIAAVVTTSGTAVANLHPAVLEAHHAGVPLVVVTADRPSGLRGTWANQTSDLQAGLFGGALRAAVDLADTDAVADPAAAARALAEALAAARGGRGRRPGPVQLNLGFTEPLVPTEPGAGVPELPAALAAAPPDAAPGPVRELDDRPTVVVAGDGAGPAAARCAEAAGWPLLAEPSSGARFGPAAVDVHRLLLELPGFAGPVRRVVVFGRPTLSRPVSRLLARPDVELVVVSPFPDWPEPGRPALRLAVPPRPQRPAPAGAGWPARWRAAGLAARAAVDAVLDAAGPGELHGPLLARELAASLGPDDVLVAAASNPVRDLDLAVPVPTAPGPRVLANRGLAGIDGTLSTALGVALTGARVTVLSGDLAFLHDLNALLAVPGGPPAGLRVVLVNDDGGGIFSLLEQGELAERDPGERARFERLFGTPHGADPALLCRGLGIEHRRVVDPDSLRSLPAMAPGALEVIEARVDRADLRRLHGRIRDGVRAAVRRFDVEVSSD